jgi:hypothetical protein
VDHSQPPRSQPVSNGIIFLFVCDSLCCHHAVPNITIARTFLSDPALVQLEGNKTQAIAFAVDPDLGATRILNQNTNVTITNTLTYENVRYSDVVHHTPTHRRPPYSS